MAVIFKIARSVKIIDISVFSEVAIFICDHDSTCTLSTLL